MRNPFVTFNRWYDKLREPWRFLLFLVLASPIVLCIPLSSYIGFIWFIPTAIYAALLLATRIWWVEYPKVR